MRRSFGKPDDAGHANRLRQLLVEYYFAPARGPIGADGDTAQARLRLVADVQHNTSVVELDRNSFAGIDRIGMSNDDMAALPGPAVVVTIDNGDTGRPMCMSACSGGQPDRNQ